MSEKKTIEISVDELGELLTDFVILNLEKARPEVWSKIAFVRRHEGKLPSGARGAMASIITSWASNAKDSHNPNHAIREWLGLAEELRRVNEKTEG